MNILIMDDDPVFSKKFIDKIKLILDTDLNSINIDNYGPSQGDLDFVKYDLVFLDIDLGSLNGMNLAKQIKTCNKSCILVYISNRLNLVFKALETQPFYFIRKSCLEEDLAVFEILLKEHLGKSYKTYLFRFKGKIKPIKSNALMYVESMGHEIIIHTDDGQLAIRDSMKNIKKTFVNETSLIQIHKSFLVNMNKVIEINPETIKLNNQHCLPIGGKYRKAFLESYTEFLLIC